MPNSTGDSLPLEWIRVFEAAGRTGSFTAAAQEIGLTQAAVSQRIRNLESRIGASLFTRQARGVTLTVDGEAWLPYVSNALQSLNRRSEELFGKPLKMLEISARTSMMQMWIVPRLAALSRTAKYQISMTTVNVGADFAKSRTSIEIRYGTGDWPDMLCARLYREVLTPMAAPSLLTSKTRWQDLPRIAVAGPRPGWQDWSAQTGDDSPPLPKFRFDTFNSAHAAAKSGIGVLLASLPLCAGDLVAGSLVVCPTGPLNRTPGTG